MVDMVIPDTTEANALLMLMPMLTMAMEDMVVMDMAVMDMAVDTTEASDLLMPTPTL